MFRMAPEHLMFYCFSLDFLFVLQHGWYMQNNSVAVLFNMLTTSRSCGNAYCCDQNYQPRKITLQVFVLNIEYLVAVSFRSGNMCLFWFTKIGMNVW